jgi:hypothetical protein
MVAASIANLGDGQTTAVHKYAAVSQSDPADMLNVSRDRKKGCINSFTNLRGRPEHRGAAAGAFPI